MPYVRTVKTALGATAVQIVYFLPSRFAGYRASGQPSTTFTADQLRTKLSQVRFQAVADVGGVGGPVPAGDLLRSRLQVSWPKWPTWPGQSLRLPKITAIEQRNRKDHPSERAVIRNPGFARRRFRNSLQIRPHSEHDLEQIQVRSGTNRGLRFASLGQHRRAARTSRAGVLASAKSRQGVEVRRGRRCDGDPGTRRLRCIRSRFHTALGAGKAARRRRYGICPMWQQRAYGESGIWRRSFVRLSPGRSSYKRDLTWTRRETFRADPRRNG